MVGWIAFSRVWHCVFDGGASVVDVRVDIA
jgi:hypothetical protein